MATDSYLKVHRKHEPAVELFFDSRNPLSVVGAIRAAREIAQAKTELAQAAEPGWIVVEATAIAVWSHGVKGLGDLKCIGGCELCSPRPDPEIVEAEEDEDLSLTHVPGAGIP